MNSAVPSALCDCDACDLENASPVIRRALVTLPALAAGLDINRLMFARFTLAQRKAEEWKVRP